jgi:hypothetical protein
MIIAETDTGKKFLLDRATFVLSHDTGEYYRTATGNFVRLRDGVWSEVSDETVKANILLLPYPIALEAFPEWFVDNPETV